MMFDYISKVNMLRFLLTIIMFINACSSKKLGDKNIEIVIDIPSYQFDLNKKTYTIYFLEKPPLVINFPLSEREQKSIVDKYHELGLDELKDEIFIEDECLTMPKFYTIISVKSTGRQQKIKIDDSCDDFYISNFMQASMINKFVEFVFQILQSKQQIKNAPHSDIFYI